MDCVCWGLEGRVIGSRRRVKDWERRHTLREKGKIENEGF